MQFLPNSSRSRELSFLPAASRCMSAPHVSTTSPTPTSVTLAQPLISSRLRPGHALATLDSPASVSEEEELPLPAAESRSRSTDAAGLAVERIESNEARAESTLEVGPRATDRQSRGSQARKYRRRQVAARRRRQRASGRYSRTRRTTASGRRSKASEAGIGGGGRPPNRIGRVNAEEESSSEGGIAGGFGFTTF